MASTPPSMPYLASLNIPDLTKLTNDSILHDPPSDISKFEGKPGEDPTNQIMSFHMWCSFNKIMEYSIHLRLFQSMLIGLFTKWYVDEKVRSHSTFESLEKSLLSFLQLPMRHDTCLDILSKFQETLTIHIAYHIHEWRRRRSICKVDTTRQKQLDWFLKSLVPLLAKYCHHYFPSN
jgi:hypothetical protein